ncbi:MAG: hypothetical protein IT424_01375 [Pirellulales bacterium]|nr:hypothetical protein [Pirellulales bacterium]
MAEVTDRRSGPAPAWRRLFASAAIIAAAAGEACASGGSPAAEPAGHAGGHGNEAAAPVDPALPRPLDLGSFDLQNFRPTHNEIANIKFSLCAVFAAGTTDAEMAKLAHWKQRLRDQAITAVRSADAEALADPQLVKVRRLLLLRLRRLALPKEVEAVYLTDFGVSSGAL